MRTIGLTYQLGAGRWEKVRLALPKIANWLSARAKEEARELLKDSIGRPLKVANYIFGPDPNELVYRARYMLENPGTYDCEDYAKLLAAIATGRGMDARVDIVDPATMGARWQNPMLPVGSIPDGGMLHAVARVEGRMVDLSGVMETGRGREHLEWAVDKGLIDRVPEQQIIGSLTQLPTGRRYRIYV